MKKSLPLLVGVLAAMSLSGCIPAGGGETQINYTVDINASKLTPVGGSTSEQNKVANVSKLSICQIDGGSTALAGQGDTGAIRSYDLAGKDGSYLAFYTTWQGVKLTWDLKPSSPAVSKITPMSNMLTIVELKYPEKGGTAIQYEPVLAKATYGECSSDTTKALQYHFNLLPEEFTFEELRVADMNKITDDKFDIVDYTLSSPYYPTNNPDAPTDKQYKYVDTYGEVVYFAPDGNWGVAGEGDHFFEFYAGAAARKFVPEKWPSLGVGKKVKVRGNMSQYCGNMQVGFVTRIDEVPAGVTVADANKTYKEVTEAQLAAVTVGAKLQKQVNADLEMNSLRKVTGHYIANSLKKADVAFNGAITAGARFTFDLQVGAQKIQIAYDYHTTRDIDGNTVDSTNLLGGLNKVINNPSKNFTINGTLRYSGNNSTPFAQTEGCWSIVPFDGAGIVEA